MTAQLQCTFKITNWKEETLTEVAGGGKITHARVSNRYDGDLQGEGQIEYLTLHHTDGSAEFTAYEKVSCTIQNKSGGFVLAHRGTFKNGIVNSTQTVVENSGTDELAGITGSILFSAGHQEEYEITFTYNLPDLD